MVFLKLGGSLITDKNTAYQAKPAEIQRIAAELKQILSSDPDLHVLVGHGSGSFGHVPAKKFHTREGVHSTAEWQGFAQVWYEARALNQLVTEIFVEAGLPVISLPPSSSVIAGDGLVQHWDTTPITAALAHGLLPVIHGDVVFDQNRGGTILSTEELFIHLAGLLHPDLILIAGSESGVWGDFPGCNQLIPEITPLNYPEIAKKIFASGAVDVTGGMASKVSAMVDLVSAQPQLQVNIFNPSTPGVLTSAFAGKAVGTVIHSQERSLHVLRPK